VSEGPSKRPPNPPPKAEVAKPTRLFLRDGFSSSNLQQALARPAAERGLSSANLASAVKPPAPKPSMPSTSQSSPSQKKD
jgi:hypothetical protein